MIRTANRVFNTSFSQSTIDAHSVVTGVSGRKIRVTGYHLVSAGTSTVQFLTGTPTDEQQTVTITGSPTGGTFTLTFDGQTTGAIAYNATAGDVDTALEALSNIAAGDLTCTGGPLPGTAVVVTFGGTLGETNVAQMTADSGGLTGGSTPTVTVTTTTGGATGTALSGAMPVASNSQLVAAASADTPLFACGSGESLYIRLTAAVALTGYVTYTLESAS